MAHFGTSLSLSAALFPALRTTTEKKPRVQCVEFPGLRGQGCRCVVRATAPKNLVRGGSACGSDMLARPHVWSFEPTPVAPQSVFGLMAWGCARSLAKISRLWTSARLVGA